MRKIHSFLVLMLVVGSEAAVTKTIKGRKGLH